MVGKETDALRATRTPLKEAGRYPATSWFNCDVVRERERNTPGDDLNRGRLCCLVVLAASRALVGVVDRALFLFLSRGLSHRFGRRFPNRQREQAVQPDTG